MVSVLGLDVGSKRIGVAGCDSTGLIAHGLTTLLHTNLDEDLEAIRRMVGEREAQAVVVGLPKNMDGTLGHQARRVQYFGEHLAAVVDVPVHYVDERLTTVQAHRLLLGVSAAKRRALIDQQAAAIILQQWLDMCRFRRSSYQDSSQVISNE